MRRRKTSQRRTAEKLAVGPARAAGGAKAQKKMARKVVANFKETPVARWGDFFVAMGARGTVLIRSGTTYLNDALVEFRDSVDEWAWVELLWWCDAQKIPVKPSTERDAIFGANRLGLYGLDMKTGLLEKIEDEPSYQRRRREKARLDRQFILIDRARLPNGALQALTERIRKIHGQGALKRALRFKP
jgi:hypothetical protein